MISSVASLWELVMFLFSYYKPTIVTWLPLLFYIYGIGRTTQNKCDTVNREYTVRNSKYEYSPYPHLLDYINRYYEYEPHI
jgi:hypothetical protein